MKNHTGMEAHDGYVPHSHEVRPDHRGVPVTPLPVPVHEVRIVQAIIDNLRAREPEPEARNGIDRNDIPMPDGWAVYFDGELVFSADEDKWREIGPGIEKIMEG